MSEMKRGTPTIPSDESEFWVQNRLEIRQELVRMEKTQARLCLFFGPGKTRFVISMILGCSVEDGWVALDLGGSDEENLALLAAGSVLAVNLGETVETKFEVLTPWIGRHSGGDAFYCKFPDRVHRVQRREFFRLPTPVANPLVCDLPLAAAGHGGDGLNAHEGTASLPVLDISLGGVRLSVPPWLVLEDASLLAGCEMTLPDGFGKVGFGLEVRHVRSGEQGGVNGGKVSAGCRFVGLDHKAESTVQKYMAALERRRRSSL